MNASFVIAVLHVAIFGEFFEEHQPEIGLELPENLTSGHTCCSVSDGVCAKLLPINKQIMHKVNTADRHTLPDVYRRGQLKLQSGFRGNFEMGLACGRERGATCASSSGSNGGACSSAGDSANNCAEAGSA